MYGRAPLRLGGSDAPAREFLNRIFGLFGQACSRLEPRAELERTVSDGAARKALWTEYSTAVDARLAEAVQTVETSSVAWLEEQRKFRELTRAVHAFGETVEREAGSLARVTEVLRSVGDAPPRPPSRADGADRNERTAVTGPPAATDAVSPEV